MALAAGKPCRQFTAYDLPGVSMSYVAIGNSRSWPTAAIIERVLITGVMLKTLGKECPTMYLWGITSVIQAISRKTTTKPTYCGSTGSSSSIPIQSNPSPSASTHTAYRTVVRVIDQTSLCPTINTWDTLSLNERFLGQALTSLTISISI